MITGASTTKPPSPLSLHVQVELVVRMRKRTRQAPPAETTTEEGGTVAPGAKMALDARGLLLKVHLRLFLLDLSQETAAGLHELFGASQEAFKGLLRTSKTSPKRRRTLSWDQTSKTSTRSSITATRR